MRIPLPLTLAGMVAVLGTAQLTAQTIRVGTFHQQSIVVAFYRSPIWAETLQQKRAEMAAAKQAGDAEKVRVLEKFGSSSQDMAHRQLAGEAAIGGIVEALRPAFAEIAGKAQVALIVAELAYAVASVQRVDVTDLLLDWLKADESTRKIVHELRNRAAP